MALGIVIDVVSVKRDQLAYAKSGISHQRNEGEPIGAVDALIAATAAESAGLRVLTRNVSEFSRVVGTDTISY